MDIMNLLILKTILLKAKKSREKDFAFVVYNIRYIIYKNILGVINDK